MPAGLRPARNDITTASMPPFYTMNRTLLIAAVLVILPQCKPASSSFAAAPKWEYRQTISFSRDFPTEELNKLGSEGWELVDYHEEREKGYYTRFTFKRLVTSSSTPAGKAATDTPAKPAN